MANAASGSRKRSQATQGEREAAEENGRVGRLRKSSKRQRHMSK
jgi:hypothetical protein